MQRWLRWACFALALPTVPCGVLAASILHFLWIIDRTERATDPRAEAIVALSGDPYRIGKAVDLLAEGRAQRLFVTGVDNADEIARQTITHPGLFACCVDVDHQGRDTQEDAAAIGRWVASRGVRSILVVTSSSHMPRALIEIHDTLPGVRTVPVAVVKGLIDLRDWRTNPDRWPLLRREYLKCLGALLRNRFPFLPLEQYRAGST